MNRRRLLRALPAAAIAVSEFAPAQEGPELSKDALKSALGMIGLSFRDAQLEQMRGNAARMARGFAALRALPLPNDVTPAFYFDPLPAGRKPPAPAPFVPPAPRVAGRFRELEEVAFWPLPELAALIRSRRVTSTALTKMYLDRLRRHGDTLHCVVTLTESLALEQAARADAELKRGRYRGLLHGIPYGAKDLFATKGIRTTWGAEPYRDQVIDLDATVITKMAEAGAVLAAKLSMGALAMGGLWFGGMTRTPWNLDKTSSGSSAGSAAATAAGLLPFALGTETLGSILTPSRICGVTGLRPTFGRVSRHGAMALCWTMDKIGPICRTAEDAMLVLRAIEGPDGKDRTVAARPLGWNAAAPARGLRVAYVAADFERLTGERKARAEEALAALRKAGLDPRPVKLPEFPTDALITILSAEAAAAFDALTRDGGVDQLSGQRDGDWPNQFRSARLLPAVEYIQAMRARTLLIQEMDAWMAPWDVVVTPSTSRMLVITNFTGHPQMSVPSGFVDGEPEAIHFTGRLYEEGKMARAAHAFQQATRWHRERPAGF